MTDNITAKQALPVYRLWHLSTARAYISHSIKSFCIGCLFVGCLLIGTVQEAAATELRVMTHDSFSLSEDVVNQFEQRNNVTVRFLKAGDAGAALNQAILSKNNPLADVFYGVDNTFFSRAIRSGIFRSYHSPALSSIPMALKLDPQARLNPVAFGDVCLNYDKAWFNDHNIAPPQDLTDLTKPQYRNLTVVQHPATSSPGLAFLLATVDRFGKDGFLAWWADMRENGVKVTTGWKESYWGDFTAASDGDRPIVVSYASSPAAEVFYADPAPETAPTAAVLAPKSGYRQIEFIGIFAKAKQQELAEKFVDFMLSRPVQRDIPLQMWVYPASSDAQLPEVFRHAAMLDHPATVDADDIDLMRERWIQEWTETVLR